MSTRQPSPPALRIPQSTVAFVILILVLGALVLSSNSIDQRASVRAEFTLTPSLTPTPNITPTPSPTPTPVDPFKSLEYIPWRSPNGLIVFDRPRTWEVVPQPLSGPVFYDIGIPSLSDPLIRVSALPIAQIQGLTDQPESASTEQLARAFLARPTAQPVQPQPTATPPTIRPIQLGNLRGSAFRKPFTIPGPETGQMVAYEAETWFLALDSKTLLIVEGVAKSTDWPKMQPIFDRLTQSLQVEQASVIRYVSDFFAARATSQGGTAAATTAATVNPAPATPVATAAATRNP